MAPASPFTAAASAHPQVLSPRIRFHRTDSREAQKGQKVGEEEGTMTFWFGEFLSKPVVLSPKTLPSLSWVRCEAGPERSRRL